MFKKIVASIILLPILIVPLFCSCESKAHADTEVGHVDDFQGDHPATHNHSDHNSSDTCNCHSFSTAAENAATIHIAFLSLPNFFPAINAVSFKSIFYSKSLVRYAYLGPPIGALSVVPLYIQFHSLRI
jgi:hypothetical protein